MRTFIDFYLSCYILANIGYDTLASFFSRVTQSQFMGDIAQ